MYLYNLFHFSSKNLQSDDSCNISMRQKLYLFTIEECILQAREYNCKHVQSFTYMNKSFSSQKTPLSSNSTLVCPKHSNQQILLELMAPDVSFIDLSTEQVVLPENIKRGKLVGRGAFGFVFNGFVKQKVIFMLNIWFFIIMKLFKIYNTKLLYLE